jgi:hypothetical protein
MQYYNNATRSSSANGCVFDFATGTVLKHNKGKSCTNEHNHMGRMLFLNGVSAASLWVWDAMRALDYLERCV